MQSGGTTIISSMWFRRPDTDGILDIHNKRFPCFYCAKATPATIFHQKLTINAKRGMSPQLYARLVAAAFETKDVKWYLIVRNPFDTIASLKSKPWGLHWARKLKKFNQAYRYARQRGVPIISYERFVENPVAIMNELYRALNVSEFTPDLLQPLARRVYFSPNSDQATFQQSGGAVQRCSRRGALSESDVKTIRRFAKTVIRKERYEL